MSKSINNVTKSVSNTMQATTGALAASTELLADTTGVISSGVSATPAVLKALLSMPFAAAKGYLMEAEGLTAEEAELAAYRYIKQDVSTTITEVGESTGKAIANMWKDEDNANSTN